MRPATAAAFHMRSFFISTPEEVNSLKKIDE